MASQTTSPTKGKKGSSRRTVAQVDADFQELLGRVDALEEFRTAVESTQESHARQLSALFARTNPSPSSQTKPVSSATRTTANGNTRTVTFNPNTPVASCRLHDNKCKTRGEHEALVAAAS